MASNKYEFAYKLRKARLAKDLSQQNLADILKISVQSIQHWERGANTPKLARMNQLAEILSVPVEYLMIQSNETENTHQTAGKKIPQILKAFAADLVNCDKSDETIEQLIAKYTDLFNVK